MRIRIVKCIALIISAGVLIYSIITTYGDVVSVVGVLLLVLILGKLYQTIEGMSDRVILEPRNLYTWRIHSTQTTYNPKYIENYLEKRIKLRKIVDRFLAELQYTADEIHRYDICYRVRVMYEALRNEWNCYLKDGSYSVDNLERTKHYLVAYIHDTTNQDLFVVAHKNYGILAVIILWLYIKDQYELLFLFLKSIEKIKK